MNIVRIEKVNLVDAVYAQLRELLVSGKWAEGTKIPSENVLSREFSVSRVVVREALQKLRGERLIVTRQGVGTYAANPSNFQQPEGPIDLSEKLYRDFLDFRGAVELTAIRLSAAAATEADFERMEACVQAMEAQRDNPGQYDLMDYNFHLAVVASSHNDLLVQAMLANKITIIDVFAAMNGIPGARTYAEAAHRQFIRNLRQKNTRQVIDDYNEMGRYNLARLQKFFKETKGGIDHDTP